MEFSLFNKHLPERGSEYESTKWTGYAVSVIFFQFLLGFVRLQLRKFKKEAPDTVTSSCQYARSFSVLNTQRFTDF